MEAFDLWEGEEIIEAFLPVYGFRNYLVTRWFFLIFAFDIMASFLLWIYVTPFADFGLLFFTVCGFVCFAAAFLLGRSAYKKRIYWITTKRVIIKHGILRKHIFIASLEGILEIKITRSPLQKLFESPGIHIKTPHGNFSLGGVLLPEGIYMELASLISQKKMEKGMIF